MISWMRDAETATSVLDVDYGKLLAAGKRILLFDLDNTLARRGMRELPQASLSLVQWLLRRGFRVGILTNRRRNADDPVVITLREHVPVVHAAGKPRRRGFVELLSQLNGTPRESVMIGDRRLTDVLGAWRMGIHMIRVVDRNRVPSGGSSRRSV